MPFGSADQMAAGDVVALDCLLPMLSAAFAIMAGNGGGEGPNRVTVGAGLYGDKRAFANGYSRRVATSTAVIVGLARSGKKTMGGGSVGFSW